MHCGILEELKHKGNKLQFGDVHLSFAIVNNLATSYKLLSMVKMSCYFVEPCLKVRIKRTENMVWYGRKWGAYAVI